MNKIQKSKNRYIHKCSFILSKLEENAFTKEIIDSVKKVDYNATRTEEELARIVQIRTVPEDFERVPFYRLSVF